MAARRMNGAVRARLRTRPRGFLRAPGAVAAPQPAVLPYRLFSTSSGFGAVGRPAPTANLFTFRSQPYAGFDPFSGRGGA